MMQVTSLLMTLVLLAPATMPSSDTPRIPTIPKVTTANLKSSNISPYGDVQVISKDVGFFDLVDTKSGKVLSTFPVHYEYKDHNTGKIKIWTSISDIAFSPNGKLIAFLNSGGVVQIHDGHSGVLLNQIKFQDKFALNNLGTPSGEEIAISADGRLLAIYSMDLTHGTIFDLKTHKKLHSVKGLSAVQAMPDGRFLGAVQNESKKKLLFWDLKTNQQIRAFEGKHDFVIMEQAEFSPNGLHFVAGGIGHLHVWETKTGKKTHSFLMGKKEWVLPGLAISHDNRYLVVTTIDRAFGATFRTRAWDIQSGKRLWNKGHQKSPNGPPIMLQRGNNFALKLGRNKKYTIWNVVSGKEQP